MNAGPGRVTITLIEPEAQATTPSSEFTVWGSNDMMAWERAELQSLWPSGYRLDENYDDGASRWSWPSSYRFVGITRIRHEEGLPAAEVRIDGVGVPLGEPSPNDFELDASNNVPTNLFGHPTSTIANPQAIDVPVDSEHPLLGRVAPFRLVLRLTGGEFAEPLPTVGPAGSGADIEVGDAASAGALGEWNIAPAEGAPGDTELAYEFTPGFPFQPLAEGTLFSVAASSLRVERLEDALSQPGQALRAEIEYEEALSRLPLDYFGVVKLALSLPGVFVQGSHSVTDEAGNSGPIDRLAHVSNPVYLSPQGQCAGFPDGGVFFQSRNCDASSSFQLDAPEDLVTVRVEGFGLRDFLSQPGAAVSLNTEADCHPSTELDYTTEFTPVSYSSYAELAFHPQSADQAFFRVCLLSGDLSLVPPQEISIQTWLDFESILLRDSPTQIARFSIIPRCFGDLNGDYRVNNADARLQLECFPCSDGQCDRRCDYDLDGVVNNRDLLAFRENFGMTCEGPPDSPDPFLTNFAMIYEEPDSLLVLANASVAGFALLSQFFVRRRARDPDPDSEPERKT